MKLSDLIPQSAGTDAADATPELLTDYERHLLEVVGNKKSTVQGNMKVIRTHIKAAVRERVIPPDVSPFAVYSPPSTGKVKRTKLSEAEIRKLERLVNPSP